MQKIAILKAANKKSSLKRPIWDAIYSRRKNKIHAHGLTGGFCRELANMF